MARADRMWRRLLETKLTDNEIVEIAADLYLREWTSDNHPIGN